MKEAKTQKKEAETQKQEALVQKQKAEESEQKAKQAQVEAETQKQEALVQKEKAEEQTNEALKTQSLFLADLSRQQTEKGNTTNGIFGIYGYDIEDIIIDRLSYNRIEKRLYINATA